MDTVTTTYAKARHESPVNIAELAMVEFSTPQQWWSMLRTARTFRRYCATNQLWLAAQNATGVVASTRTWHKTPAIGGGVCRIADNARGLSILTPTSFTTPTRPFQIMTVFEDNQLVTAPDLPSLTTPPALTGPNACQHLWTAITALLSDDGWTVHVRSRNPEASNGRTHPGERSVAINDDITLAERVTALLHEWGHITFLHHPTTASEDVKEVEARSVAHLVGATIGVGVDVSSLDIGAILELDAGAAAQAAERVLSVSQHLTQDIENELGIDLTPDLLATRTAPTAPHNPVRHPPVGGSTTAAHSRPTLRSVSYGESGVTDTSAMVDIPAAVLAAVIDAVRALDETDPTSRTLITALTEAVDRWVCDSATEHHFSQRFTINTPTEPFAAAVAELIAAVQYLQSAGDDSITVAETFEEALTTWLIDVNANRRTAPPTPARNETTIARPDHLGNARLTSSPAPAVGQAVVATNVDVVEASDRGVVRQRGLDGGSVKHGGVPVWWRPRVLLRVFGEIVIEPPGVPVPSMAVPFIVAAAERPMAARDVAVIAGYKPSTLSNAFVGGRDGVLQRVDGELILADDVWTDYGWIERCVATAATATDRQRGDEAASWLRTAFDAAARVTSRAFAGRPAGRTGNAEYWMWVNEFPADVNAKDHAEQVLVASVLWMVAVWRELGSEAVLPRDELVELCCRLARLIPDSAARPPSATSPAVRPTDFKSSGELLLIAGYRCAGRDAPLKRKVQKCAGDLVAARLIEASDELGNLLDL